MCVRELLVRYATRRARLTLPTTRATLLLLLLPVCAALFSPSLSSTISSPSSSPSPHAGASLTAASTAHWMPVEVQCSG